MSFWSTKQGSTLDDFEAAIAQNLDGLYNAALRYTRDRAVAEDLVHDTVVKVLRFRERFEPGTNFKAWAHTILTHTFIHRYRRQKREREILEGQHRQDVDRQLHSQESLELAQRPEASYLEHLLSDDVIKALDSLGEEFRAVVVLCDLEGLSYKEIAEALSCPVGTVMSRLYRGRRLLEDQLYELALERGVIKTTRGEPVVDIRSFRRRKSG